MRCGVLCVSTGAAQCSCWHMRSMVWPRCGYAVVVAQHRLGSLRVGICTDQVARTSCIMFTPWAQRPHCKDSLAMHVTRFLTSLMASGLDMSPDPDPPKKPRHRAPIAMLVALSGTGGEQQITMSIVR
jgi:hypothetical protein